MSRSLTFYVGCPEPAWIARTDAPLFVSRTRLVRIKGKLPAARGPWALDSGGFTEISANGRWTLDAAQYAQLVRRFVAEVGMPDFAAPQDWMCEPEQLAITGLSVAEHQRRTVANFVELRELLPGVPVMPVVQGWTRGDYLDCVQLYLDEGVDLRAEPRVGVGSVCRRQATISSALIFSALRSEGLSGLHGFGVSLTGLRLFGDELASADSQAWSANARHNPDEPCPEGRNSCRNCLHRAIEWRADALTASAA